MTPTDKLLPCREAFEIACEREDVNFSIQRDIEHGGYLFSKTRSAWVLWQQAWNIRATPPTPLPDAEALVEKLEAVAFNPTGDDRMGRFVPLDKVIALIHQHAAEQAAQVPVADQASEERIAYHEAEFDKMKDIFLLESLRCAGLNACEPALWMGICRSAMKRLSMRESNEAAGVDAGKEDSKGK